MKKILIVDDNAKNIQVLAKVLSDNNYEIDYSENGEEAINQVKDTDFDLILMDVMMPVLDGYEACAAIKELPLKGDIPIIFLTAKLDEESITKGFDAGGVDYISKPFNIKELLVRVKTQIELKDNKETLQKANILLEQKVLERTKELKQANKELEVLDNSKNDFLRIISHEIRSPLNGILGFSSLLQRSIDNAEELEYIKALDESCKRLEYFALRALKVSALKTKGEKLITIKSLQVHTFLADLLGELEHKGSFKNLTINYNCVGSSTIKVDPEQFHECIYIILNNAISHAPKNGEININFVVQPESFKCSIKNSGDGFDEKYIESGISSFLSPNHYDSNPGLDLYLCRLITEAHGGSISISNDNGAVVEVDIPIVNSVA